MTGLKLPFYSELARRQYGQQWINARACVNSRSWVFIWCFQFGRLGCGGLPSQAAGDLAAMLLYYIT
jgi:hypothetical protein